MKSLVCEGTKADKVFHKGFFGVMLLESQPFSFLANLRMKHRDPSSKPSLKCFCRELGSQVQQQIKTHMYIGTYASTYNSMPRSRI